VTGVEDGGVWMVACGWRHVDGGVWLAADEWQQVSGSE